MKWEEASAGRGQRAVLARAVWPQRRLIQLTRNPSTTCSRHLKHEGSGRVWQLR